MEKKKIDIPFEIITIQEQPKKLSKGKIKSKKRIRVCAYARVSTEKEEQEYSFDRQVEYYTKYIKEKDDWQFVGIYADLGLSGKNKKRPQFMEMLQKCRNGQIDKIITKSISRFARNTVDCLQTVRELKDRGIGVYFEKEGIDSLAPGIDSRADYPTVFKRESDKPLTPLKLVDVKAYDSGAVLIRYKTK